MQSARVVPPDGSHLARSQRKCGQHPGPEPAQALCQDQRCAEVLPDAATILDQNHSSAVTRCRDHGLLEGARDDSGYWCLTVKGLLHCIDKFGIL